MGAEELVQTVIGTGIIYLAVNRLKTHLPEEARSWIPELSALLGVVLVCLALALAGPVSGPEWLLGVLRGVSVGYAATGIHAAIQQFQEADD